MRKVQLIILAVACLLDSCFAQYGGGTITDFCTVLGVSGKPRCSRKAAYRFMNGTCNNIDNPFWGTAASKYIRLLPNRYADHVSAVPINLPSARQISNTVFSDQDNPDTEYTMAQMQFGQFVAHDMGSTGGSTQTGCCETGKLAASRAIACFPITMPKDDPTQIDFPRDCMNFMRTQTDRDQNCPIPANLSAPAEQINIVTSYLDLSHIYGNSDAQLKAIRSFTNGRLIVDVRANKTWPPKQQFPAQVCTGAASPIENCYASGDSRLNTNPEMTVLHILFLREHNRIADALKKLNDLWDDTRLFEEARRINIAQYQYITYYEWLPNLIGEDRMRKAGLLYDAKGGNHADDYNPFVDASTINEHSTVAFRFPHTQIVGQIKLLTETRKTKKIVALRDWFDRPQIIEDDNNLDFFGRGMTTQQCQGSDFNYEKDVRDFLNKHLRKYGDDLKAFDIQRDRDHGIGLYNDAREFCGLGRFTNWTDLVKVMAAEDVDDLKKVYTTVDQIELSVGGALEYNLINALSGPTYNCLFIKQYYNTRVGDRFWFETDNKYTGFGYDQLNQIRQASMARIFCDNGNDIKTMQPKAFKLISNGNARVSCTELPIVKLDKWYDDSAVF